MIGETPAVPAFPLRLFPATQARVRACLEAADEAMLAGLDGLRDRLIATARNEVHELRAQIGGLNP